MGSPRGLTGTVTAGILSAVRDDAGIRLLQTDAAVNPGNSGGPLLNSKAQVIGIVTAKLRREGLNFAVPINYVRGMLADLSGPPIDMQTLRTKLGVTKDEFQAKPGAPAPALPERWKSLRSPTVRSLRLVGDHLYAELLPPLPAGVEFQMYELRRQGTGFIGSIRDRIACVTRDIWVGNETSRSCNLETPVEFKSVSLDRIEGRTMSPEKGNNFNCKKCAFDKPLTQWQDFVWIPE